MPLEFKKKDETMDTLPEGDEPEVVTSSIEDEKRRLELENAELRGYRTAHQEKEKPTPIQSTHEQTKQRVYADVNTLDEDKFREVYGMDKNKAMMAVLERENQLNKAEAKRATAEAEAKTEMGIKYGSSFYQYKAQVEEAVADLSEEVRGNPQKLARAMERFYLSFQKEGVIPKKAVDDRKKMVSDFEKPTPSAAADDKKKEGKEIPEAYKPFSKVFGIQSEEERQELMGMIKEGEFVPMNMGGGYWFKNPQRGFERVEPKA